MRAVLMECYIRVTAISCLRLLQDKSVSVVVSVYYCCHYCTGEEGGE